MQKIQELSQLISDLISDELHGAGKRKKKTINDTCEDPNKERRAVKRKNKKGEIVEYFQCQKKKKTFEDPCKKENQYRMKSGNSIRCKKLPKVFPPYLNELLEMPAPHIDEEYPNYQPNFKPKREKECQEEWNKIRKEYLKGAKERMRDYTLKLFYKLQPEYGDRPFLLRDRLKSARGSKVWGDLKYDLFEQYKNVCPDALEEEERWFNEKTRIEMEGYEKERLKKEKARERRNRKK
jgi:hypothetical protein